MARPHRTRGPRQVHGVPLRASTAVTVSDVPRLLAPPPPEGFFAQEPPDEFDRNLQNMKALIDFYLQGEVRARLRGARGQDVRATWGPRRVFRAVSYVTGPHPLLGWKGLGSCVDDAGCGHVGVASLGWCPRVSSWDHSREGWEGSRSCLCRYLTSLRRVVIV